MNTSSKNQTPSSPPSGKKFRWGSMVGFTTLGFLVLCGGMYYTYASDKEEYLISRNFRLLAIWSNELTETLESYKKVFESTVRTSMDKKEKVSTHSRIIYRTGSWISLPEQVRLEEIKGVLQALPRLHHVQVGDGRKNETSTIGLNISPHSTRNTLSLVYNSPEPFPKTKISAEIDIATLMGEIIEEPPFEDVMIADPQGNVRYQKNPSLFRWTNLLTLLHNRIPEDFFTSLLNRSQERGFSAPKGENLSAQQTIPKPSLQTISLGGKSYRLFLQPVRIPYLSSDGKVPGSQDTQWVIAALISSQSFRKDYLSIPYTYLLVFVFVVLLVLLSLPLCRLWMMGAHERIRLFNIFSLVLTALIGTAVLTFFFLDLSMFLNTKKQFNQQLRQEANLLHNTFQNELRRLLWQLNHYDLSPQLAEDSQLVRQEPRSSVARIKMDDPCRDVDSTNHPSPSLFCYSGYDLVFWMDPRGTLKINWTRDTMPAVNGSLDLSSREYVQRVLDPKKPLWHLNVPQPETGQNRAYQFYIEPIISWTTGWNSVVVSMESHHLITDSSEKETGLKVAALETRFSSIMKNPVLPPGAGFAIIRDKDGLVLFHSKGKRNLRENFFSETDQNPQLQGLVSARNPGNFEGQYGGIGYQFYARPMKDIPWTLVLFQDKSLLRATNFEMLLLAGSLYTLYAIVFLGVTLLGFLFVHTLKGNHTLRLWPSAHYHSHYNGILLAAFFTLIAEAFLFRSITASKSITLMLVMSLPALLVFLLTIMMTRSAHARQTQRGGTPPRPQGEQVKAAGLFPFPISFLGMVISFIILFSAFPAAMFFNISYHAEMELLGKYSVLGFSQGLKNYDKFATYQPLRAIGAMAPLPPDQTDPSCWNAQQRNPNASFVSFTNQDLASQGMYKDFLFKTCVWFAQAEKDASPNTQGSMKDEVFNRFHRFMRIPSLHGKELIKTWGLIVEAGGGHGAAKRTSQAENQWLATDQDVTLIKDILSLPTSHSLGPKSDSTKRRMFYITAALPPLPWATVGLDKLASPWYMSFGFMAVILFCLLWVVQRRIVQRLFLINVSISDLGKRPGSMVDMECPHAPNVMMLGLPGSGKSYWLEQHATSHWHVEDMRHVGDAQETQGWAQAIVDKLGPQIHVVALDHFDYKLGMPRQDQEKQCLLRLLLTKNVRICLLSKVDITQPLLGNHQEAEPTTSQPSSQGEIQNWASLLQSFVTIYYWDPGDPELFDHLRSDQKQHTLLPQSTNRQEEILFDIVKQECGINHHMQQLGQWILAQHSWRRMSENELIAYILDLAHTYYQTIWVLCTIDEKLALFHLAQDRFIHFKHAGLPTLLHKGLLCWGPDLRLRNESFRRFVLSAAARERLADHEKKSGTSVWGMLKWPLGFVLATIVFFLIATQQELRSSFLTFISLVPILFPVLSDLSGSLPDHKETT